MKLKLKSLVVAMAMVATGVAQAATISTDNWSQANFGTGTGEGGLFLSIWDQGVSQSLVVDLNLTALDFMTNNASLISTFSLTSAALQSFIGASPDQSALLWNIAGLRNGPGAVFSNVGLLTTNGTAGATIDPGTEGPSTNGVLALAMDNGAGYVNNNNPVQTVQGSGDAGYHGGGNWGGDFGGSWTWNNQHTGFVGGEMMSFISFDESDTPIATAFSNAEWMVNPSTGTVSYVGQVSAVPVPAAVWLFGSGLVGLVSIARRRNQA